MKNAILEISETAISIVDNKEYGDADLCKIAVLYPFIEALGYDTTTVGDIKIAPLYTPDGSYKMDYGLRGKTGDSIKTLIKVIGYGEDPEADFKKIRTCVMQKDDVEYIIITDCFRYFIYAYNSVKNDLLEIHNFDITKYEDINFCTLDKMIKPEVSYEKQEYAYDEHNEYMTDDEDEYEGPSKEYRISTLDDPEEENTVPRHEPVKDTKSSKNKMMIFFIVQATIIIVAIIACLVMFRGNDGKLNIFKAGTQNELDFFSADNKLTVTADGQSGNIDIAFSSKDIPAGANIKFIIQNGNNSSVLYKELDASSNIKTKLAIPTDWDRPEIVVVAYLRFDESSHPQPANVTDKFGSMGEKLVGVEGAPDKFALSIAKINWDSEAVRAYLKWEEEQKLIKENQQRKQDFAGADVRYDSMGNIKVIPKGFDMNQNNITESRNIYPQIFFNAEENTAYFYLICGYVGQKWSMFKNVSFYADGYEWNYEISSNEKKQTVNGGYVTEWVYFHNFNIPTLMNDADLLAKSKSSTIRFSGYSIKEHALSNDEKAMIASMLNLWDKYFDNPEVEVTTDWFKEVEVDTSNSGLDQELNKVMSSGESGSYALNYIIKPDSMDERNKNEQIALNEIQNKIQEIRKKGGTPSAGEQERFAAENVKFRRLPDEFRDQLFDYINLSKGELIYYQDFENSEIDYYKIYFNYDKYGSVEVGYIPFIYVMENKKIYFPIQTNANDGSKKSYVSLELNQNLYNELVQYVNVIDYK